MTKQVYQLGHLSFALVETTKDFSVRKNKIDLSNQFIMTSFKEDFIVFKSQTAQLIFGYFDSYLDLSKKYRTISTVFDLSLDISLYFYLPNDLLAEQKFQQLITKKMTEYDSKLTLFTSIEENILTNSNRDPNKKSKWEYEFSDPFFMKHQLPNYMDNVTLAKLKKIQIKLHEQIKVITVFSRSCFLTLSD